MILRAFNNTKAYPRYQCYLAGSGERLARDAELARALGAPFRAKLVRGAYMPEARAAGRLRASKAATDAGRVDHNTGGPPCRPGEACAGRGEKAPSAVSATGPRRSTEPCRAPRTPRGPLRSPH